MASIADSVRRANRLRIGFAFNLKPANVAASSPDATDGSSSLPRNLNHTESHAPSSGDQTVADTYAEWDEEPTIAAVEAALAPAGEVIRLEADSDFPARLREAHPDIVFNLAEGMGGPSRESHVPAFCEFWGIPYSGSDPLALGICLDKARAKEALSHHGIPTPEFQVVESPAEVRRSLPLPAIVKPLHEGSSKGITQRSVCRDWEAVAREVAIINDRYREPAIVERFLDGREFTVAVLGNDGDCRVLPIVELDLGTLPVKERPIYGFEAKWLWDRPEQPLEIFQCPARCTPELQARIEDIALTSFRRLRCRDWARIDVRCNERGKPYVLELNPLPGVLPDPAANSCYPKAARAAGLSFDEMILSVLRAAAARYGIAVGA